MLWSQYYVRLRCWLIAVYSLVIFNESLQQVNNKFSHNDTLYILIGMCICLWIIACKNLCLLLPVTHLLSLPLDDSLAKHGQIVLCDFVIYKESNSIPTIIATSFCKNIHYILKFLLWISGEETKTFIKICPTAIKTFRWSLLTEHLLIHLFPLATKAFPILVTWVLPILIT